MNVFVLCTGRTGSTTFIQACKHIKNYTPGHESLTRLVGSKRLAYPDNHIEADNRLAWFLGRLENQFGQEAYYVHLRRNEEATAHSFLKRYDSGMMLAYRRGILRNPSAESSNFDVCLDYCRTVNSNIELYLRDKPHKMTIWLETAKEDFPMFWRFIQAEGDLVAASSEWDRQYNASDTTIRPPTRHRLTRLPRKISRIVRRFPEFIRKA